MKKGYVYIVTNKTNKVLYTGVTSNLMKRIYDHKSGIASKFTKKYNCNKLVFYNEFPTINEAIMTEKKIKAGSRNSKNKLIESSNPEWTDLSLEWYK